jgi:hypothetical protein
MKKIIKSLVSLSLIWMIVSCEKDEITSTTSNKKQFDMNSFFSQVAPTRQSFTITAGQVQQIQGAKGTIVRFNANSFKRSNGQILNSGTVTIILQEMLTAPEMILANKTTTSNGQLLKSGGQILLKAYLGNEELLVNAASKPTVEIPTKTGDAMNLFYGTVKANDSLVGDTSVNWNQDTTTVNVVQDSARSGGYYNFKIDSFSYINCDKFYDQNPKTDVKITVPATFVDSNTAVFVYFTAINSVARVYKFDKTNNSFILDGGYAMPIGMSVKIVLVAKKGTQYYYEIKSTTITSNFNTSLNPSSSDLNSIKTAISSM